MGDKEPGECGREDGEGGVLEGEKEKRERNRGGAEKRWKEKGGTENKDGSVTEKRGRNKEQVKELEEGGRERRSSLVDVRLQHEAAMNFSSFLSLSLHYRQSTVGSCRVSNVWWSEMEQLARHLCSSPSLPIHSQGNTSRQCESSTRVLPEYSYLLMNETG